MKTFYCLTLFFFSNFSIPDSFFYNSYSNHGVIGLVNMPTARIYNNSSIGLTLYDGTPDQKISLSFSFLNALEFSIFETKIRNIKDKGLNIKLVLRPASM